VASARRIARRSVPGRTPRAVSVRPSDRTGGKTANSEQRGIVGPSRPARPSSVAGPQSAPGTRRLCSLKRGLELLLALPSSWANDCSPLGGCAASGFAQQRASRAGAVVFVQPIHQGANRQGRRHAAGRRRRRWSSRPWTPRPPLRWRSTERRERRGAGHRPAALAEVATTSCPVGPLRTCWRANAELLPFGSGWRDRATSCTSRNRVGSPLITPGRSRCPPIDANVRAMLPTEHRESTRRVTARRPRSPEVQARGNASPGARLFSPLAR